VGSPQVAATKGIDMILIDVSEEAVKTGIVAATGHAERKFS
jgi:hypothetical protein